MRLNSITAPPSASFAPTLAADQLGQVMGVDASAAQPTVVIFGVDPTATAGGAGAAPVAVRDAVVVLDNTKQAIDVTGFDEPAAVAASHGDAGHDVQGEEMTPASVDHAQDGGFTDPPAGVTGLVDQATLQATVMPGAESTGNLLAATAFALLDGGGFLRHTSILTR
jgi:hypothetical protein